MIETLAPPQPTLVRRIEFAFGCPLCDELFTVRLWKVRGLRQRVRCAVMNHALAVHRLGDRERSLLADRVCEELGL